MIVAHALFSFCGAVLPDPRKLSKRFMARERERIHLLELCHKINNQHKRVHNDPPGTPPSRSRFPHVPPDPLCGDKFASRYSFLNAACLVIVFLFFSSLFWVLPRRADDIYWILKFIDVFVLFLFASSFPLLYGGTCAFCRRLCHWPSVIDSRGLCPDVVLDFWLDRSHRGNSRRTMAPRRTEIVSFEYILPVGARLQAGLQASLFRIIGPVIGPRLIVVCNVIWC